MFLAAKRVHDRALESFRKLHEAVVGTGTAATAEQRDALGGVQEIGQSRQFGFGRPNQRCCWQQPRVG
jgi:hypothetical protein